MSFLPPPKLKLDARGEVSDMLLGDPFTAVAAMNALTDTYPRSAWAVMEAAADQIVIDPASIDADTQREAILTGVAMAFMAGLNSDLVIAEPEKGPRWMRSSLGKISVATLPISLKAIDPAERVRAAGVVARDSHRAHPELRTPTNRLMEFQATMADDGVLGHLAYIGSGIGINQLDEGWFRARNAILAPMKKASGTN